MKKYKIHLLYNKNAKEIKIQSNLKISKITYINMLNHQFS